MSTGSAQGDPPARGAASSSQSVESAAAGGVTWQYCRPPVAGLEYEMDCRGVGREIVI